MSAPLSTAPAPAPPAPPVPAPAPGQPPAPAPAPTPAPPPGNPPAPAGEPQDVASLPEWAQKLIGDTRQEAAANRVGKTEAEQRYQAVIDAAATALGLKKTETDPVKLAEQLAASQADARRRTVELEVFRQAPQHQGDPAKLLDSRRFMDRASALDPAASDFGGRLAALIKEETDANAHLKLGATVPSFDSGARPSTPSSAGREQGLAEARKRFGGKTPTTS